MTDLPEFEHLKGQVPGGYEDTGRTWDDVVGACGPVTIAVIGKKSKKISPKEYYRNLADYFAESFAYYYLSIETNYPIF
jgi:hypothetical protein